MAKSYGDLSWPVSQEGQYESDQPPDPEMLSGNLEDVSREPCFCWFDMGIYYNKKRPSIHLFR